MRYSFNRLRGVGLGQILPHVRENREIGLEYLPAVIDLLEAAIGDTDQVASAEWKTQEIMHTNCKLYQYYAGLKVIAADLDWNLSAW